MSGCPRRGRDFMTSYWGPSFWRTMHVSAVNYSASPKAKRVWRNYLHSMLPMSMPCAKCRKHYLQKEKHFNYRKILSTREKLMRFLNKLHNDVSRDIALKTGKKFRPFTFKRHCRELTRSRSRSRARSSKSRRGTRASRRRRR